MFWNLAAYWGLGLPVGWWLAFRRGWGIVGLWDGLWLALIVTGIGLSAVLYLRSRQQSRQPN
jgi:MATE family multidrug resistance protein